MIPLYTQKILDQLTWNEVQKIHSGLGLKGRGTRRELQNRIVAAMPQPVAEPEQVATPLTCATCPLAILIEDNRYECSARVTNAVTRGHWEAKDECYTEVAAQAEPVAEVQAPIAPQEVQGKIQQATPPTIAQTPHPHVEESIIVAMTKRTPFEEKMDKLDYLYQLEMKAQLAIEATILGSEEEAEAYRCLRAIEGEIELHNSPVITQLEVQMKEVKEVLSLFKIEAFDPSILPTDECSVSSADEPKAEGAIHWETPFKGVIVGKEGVERDFYIRNDEIFIMFPGDFIASETKKPNVRHAQIRDAINVGRTFDSKAFKDSPQFLTDTKDYGGIGRTMQGADGRWWAWKQGGITGHPFFSRKLACKYLDRVATQTQLVCAN